MAKKKPSVAPTEPETTEEVVQEGQPTVDVAEPAKGSVTVTWNGGTREFSSKVHGKDFKKLAAQFAEKFKGTVA